MTGVRVVLEPKVAAEIIRVKFDFSSLLAPSDSINTATVTAAVWSGTDANPSAIISGAVSFSFGNRIASQTIINGVPGVIYQLTCSAVTLATSQTLMLTGYLAILPAVVP